MLLVPCVTIDPKTYVDACTKPGSDIILQMERIGLNQKPACSIQ